MVDSLSAGTHAPLIPDVAVSYGTLRAGAIETRYYTSQPSPTQWIAVATVRLPVQAAPRAGRTRLLVGVGRLEAEAIRELHSRLMALQLAD